MFFVGSFDYYVDEKGRINFPSPFRSQLPKRKNYFFYVTFHSKKGCLYILPPEEFEKMSLDMEKDTGSFLNPNENSVVYEDIMSDTHQCHLDSQWRLTLPRSHLEKANIRDKVKVVGLKNKIQLWNPDVFQKRRSPARAFQSNPDGS